MWKRIKQRAMNDQQKVAIPDFTPNSQYACTKCIVYKRISTGNDMEVGDHICFERELKFYHAIVADVVSDPGTSRVKIQIVHASRKSQLPLARKIFGHAFVLHDVVVLESIQEICLDSTNIYVIQYGRKTYKKEKVLYRALSLVQRSLGQDVTIGSLSSVRIRPHAQFRHNTIETTSGHFASWCTTGESFCFESCPMNDRIEYTKNQKEISMVLTIYKKEDPVKEITEMHQQRLLCDSCFLSELVQMINGLQKTQNSYRLALDDAAWINERKIPCGLYCASYNPMMSEVIIKLERYNSKYKYLALIVKIETFVFTLTPGQPCRVECEVKYKFPYPFWKIPSRDDEKF